MTSRGRVVAAVLAAAVLAVVLSGSVSTPSAAQQRRVVVVGDSIILGAQSTMVPAFQSRGWQVTFDAAVNRSTSAALGAVEAHRPELTDSLVLSVGANDAGNTGAFARRVAAILDATASVPHVYVLTIREVRGYYGAANQALRDVAAGRPNVTVLDWHAATAGDTSLTAGDGLHLNGAGAARMTQLVTDAVIAGVLPVAAAPPTTAAPSPPPATAPPTAPPPTTAAPTTPVPTTAAPTITDDPAEEPIRTSEELAVDDVERTAGDSVLDAGALWTVGGGVGLLVAAFAGAGLVLAAWSLRRPAAPAAPVPSPSHPAVRARLRAERIAAATETAQAHKS